MQITVGAGLSRPQGQRVEVAGVEGLAQALRDAPPATEAWWSPHVFRLDYRDSEGWEATWCIGIDIDQEGHAPISGLLAQQLDEVSRGNGLSGSIYHRTPAGARIVFALDAECRDNDAFARAADGAAKAVADDLRELGIQGLSVDSKPHRDLARLFFTPNSIAKGVRRQADVLVLRHTPYTLAELHALAPEPKPVLRSVPSLDEVVSRARSYIGSMGGSVEGQHGDDHAFRVAAYLVNDFALPEDAAWALLVEWNATCFPPWDERDLRRFLRSAAKNSTRPLGVKLLEDRPRATQVTATPAAPAQATRKGIPLVRAEDVTEEPVEWLIPGFIARRELTDLSGDPGVGKGGILASWAARVTSTSDEGVILFSTEDRLGHVKARLRAEGADLRRVLLLDIREANSNPILPGDIDLVEQAVREYRAALVAFDPALEFMASGLDSHKQQDVQQFAASLGNMAHRTGAACLTVRHNNKSQGVSAVYKSAGSIAFIARARMALMAGKDKENGGRVLTVVKGNIGKDTTAVSFEIVERDGSTVVAWGEAVSVSADELVNQDPKKRGRPSARIEAGVDLLKDMLAAGPMKTDDVLRCAKSEGVSRATVYRAKREMGLVSCTMDLCSAWRLP